MQDIFYPRIAKKDDFRPALCVGAGPSLQKNIGDIDARLYDLISCDKVVPKLAEIGITPTYIVALNSAPTPVREWLAPALNKCKLVVPCVVHPTTIEGWKDENIIWINNMVVTMLHETIEAELKMPPLVIGSNAGTFAYLIATYTFHNPISYSGLDFSFTSKRAVLDRQDARKYNYIEMTDVNGDARWLDLGWWDMAQAFQDWVRFYAEMFGTRTVNCTEGGINYSSYTDQMSLKEFNKSLLEVK